MPKIQRCATFESMQNFAKRNPNAETEKQFEDWMKAKIKQNKQTNVLQSNSYIIPVIFHVIHDNESISDLGRNITRAKIDSQLAQLNRDFANQSGSTYNGVAANTQIQFCLARLAPDGTVLSEPGIDRIDRNTKGWSQPPYNGNSTGFAESYVDATVMPQSIWDPYKYFNVWTLELQDNLLGKSTFPISSNLPGLSSGETDTHAGVFVHYQSIGSIFNPGFGGSSYGLGRTLTHESGHFLGLRHIWGDFLFCWTDYCDDTPPQFQKTSGCPIQPASNNCLPLGNKMFENYMDYTDDACVNTFTEDQKYRIQIVMENSPRRIELATSNVCCSLPDLTIIGQSVNPESIIAGSNVTVFFAEDNSGSFIAGYNNVNIHLSEDNILTPGLNGDIYLDTYFVNQGISPLSQTILLSKQVTIPASTPAGIYYLFIAADGGQAVDECDEDNNFATVLISVSDSVATSQSGYKLWFDNAYNSGISYSVSSSSNYNIQKFVSTTGLVNGLHTLNFHFKKDTLLSSILSAFFYKPPATANTGNGRYEYWADGNYGLRISKTKPNSSTLVVLDSLDMSSFADGLHVLNIRFKPTNGLWSSVAYSFFYKLPSFPTGTPKYQYWYDNNWTDTTSVNISNSNLLVLQDSLMTSLSEGLHTLNMRFRINGGLWSSVVSSFFYRGSSQNAGASSYQYWFDDKFQDSVTNAIGNITNYVLLNTLPANSMANGLHTLNIRFKIDGKKWSSVNSSFFYKDNDALVPINNLATQVYWYDNDWQNPKAISIIGAQNISWILNTDVAELSQGRHRLSMAFKDDRGKWSSIVSDSFTRGPIAAQICLNGNRQFVSGIVAGSNSSYQWQVDDGNGFVNISNNLAYSGATTDTLQLTNSPTSWYGYKYRCMVTNGLSSVTGPIYTLKFGVSWTGSQDSNWINPANWYCNTLPDYNTDVYINANAPNYPFVSSNVSCRSLNLQPGTSMQIEPGFNVNITGKQ